MRALFSHPAQLLVCTALLLGLGVDLLAAVLPLPIGRLSDYGAVLDRHGRERINELITSARERYGIDVYILASWENPLPTPEAFAHAVFEEWGLGDGDGILAVFLRTGLNWTVHVVASDGVRAAFDAIDRELQSRIADLVAHRRVEEAMVALFGHLDRILSPARPSSPDVGTRPGLSSPVLLLILLAVVASLAAIIHWRVCPRCGRLLRSERRPRLGRSGREHRVYSCRRCGYRRQER